MPQLRDVRVVEMESELADALRSILTTVRVDMASTISGLRAVERARDVLARYDAPG
jgi:hypothetical protein